MADVESRGVGLPADGPKEAVDFLDGPDLLLVILLLWIPGDDSHFKALVCFTHRLHLGALPQVNARVLQLFGAVCADKAVKIPKNLQENVRQGRIPLSPCDLTHVKAVFYLILTPVWRITRDVFEPSVDRIPAISTAM